MRAAAGAVVSLYVDLVAPVHPLHVIATNTGRRYLVLEVRVQARGAHAGRQHLKAVVMGPNEQTPAGARVHTIRWYKRSRRRVTA